tara:strand:+ start:130 stop:309 length:180 start_codon:yes stop_codon:yes gene_type:complete
MNNYSIMTVATVTTEYRIKANNKKEAEKKFYSGEWYQSDELDIHDEIIDRVDLNEENVE